MAPEAAGQTGCLQKNYAEHTKLVAIQPLNTKALRLQNHSLKTLFDEGKM